MLETNNQIELAGEFLRNTGVNIFLTGKAGTGKTTFLRSMVESLNKRVVVAAPTGVAAINARGVTLHSLFQLPFAPNVPKSEELSSKEWAYRKMGSRKLALIRSIEVLIIDEISMVRSDTLDAVDETLRRVRHNSKPFGGVQLLMIGDIKQLSPICQEQEWRLLSNYYASPYFFDSNALKTCEYVTVELKHIFRQKDREFTNLLNSVRDNNITNDVVNKLNSRYIPNFKPTNGDGYITLTSHNSNANYINRVALNVLDSNAFFYNARVTGDYPESAYPNDKSLELKVGAQVIFIKNDSSAEKLYYNGMIGRVVTLNDNFVTVTPNNGGDNIVLTAVTWENIEYSLDNKTGEIQESIKGTYTQIPLKCAWAITIHKSQGLTFDKAIIDAGNSFAHGQVYVALSRCRTFEGMVLKSPIRMDAIIRDSTVEDFSEEISRREPNQNLLDWHKRGYYYSQLSEVFNFDNLNRITYSISRLINTHIYKEYPNLCDSIKELTESINKELKRVGESFQEQMKGAVYNTQDYVTDAFIKERLFKASEYFSKQMIAINSIVDEVFKIKTDIKDINKRLKALLEESTEELAIKDFALKLCADGFSCEDYLKGKFEIITMKGNKATNERAKGRERAKTVVKINSDIIHEELYNIMVEWRKSRAQKSNVPAYNVMNNRSLVEIQAMLPTSVEMLQMVSGVGATKLKTYGNEIVDMVLEYINNWDIDINEYHTERNYLTEEPVIKRERKKVIKEPKIDSHIITLELFKQGKSIDEIVDIRGLVHSTIYGHLAKNIEFGAIALEDVMDYDTIVKISNAIEGGAVKFVDIQEVLNDSVSYEDVRLVKAKYKWLNIEI
ncbi:MAG: AAA family ATPase [Bacteroidales bacterium]